MRAAGKQLGLSARGTWGGYRAGAGRKRIPRDKRGYVPHITRPRVTKSTPVHVTLRCVDGLRSLRHKRVVALIESIFAAENRKGFRLIHYSIQTNHLHLIAEGFSARNEPLPHAGDDFLAHVAGQRGGAEVGLRVLSHDARIAPLAGRTPNRATVA